MSDDARDNPFPLPLVPFERYMLRDDTVEYPMTYCLVLDFLGQFDRPAFEGALDEALNRHPLLRSVVQRVPKRGDCWVAAPGRPLSLDWNESDEPLESPQDNVIDLQRDLGVRLWMCQGNGCARLTVQFHHACTDGVGALHFIGDLLAAYALRTPNNQKHAGLVPLKSTALRDRDRFDVEPPEPVSQWQVLKASVAEGAKYFGRKAVPLAKPNGSMTGRPSSTLPLSGICSHTFSRETTTALSRVAKQREVTINDLLLRDVFRLVADWNALHEPRGGRGWTRINMPVNLRGRNHRRMPAANAMSYAFLARRSADCHDPDRLLAWIRRETELIKYWSLSLIHLGGLTFFVKVPGLFWLMTRRRCMASVVVSNLGDPTRHFRTRLRDANGHICSGNVILERLTGSPPIRPLTRASMLVTRYAGRLTLGLRCDPRWFRPDDTQAFMTQYVELLEQSAMGY